MSSYDACASSLKRKSFGTDYENPDNISTTLATLFNDGNYYLPDSLQKVIVEYCTDTKIQQFAQEWQVGDCLINNSSLPKKASKNILEYLFGDTDKIRIHIQIFYTDCFLGGTLSGTFGIPSTCSLQINYGNGKIEQLPTDDWWQFCVNKKILIHKKDIDPQQFKKITSRPAVSSEEVE